MQRRKSLGVPVFFPDWLELHEVTEQTRIALEQHARGRLLDVGCGEMPYRTYGPGVESWTGLDVPSNVEAHLHGSADSIPAGDCAFDTVLCTQVLEHVPEPEAALREICRVLAPNGTLILAVPQYWEAHEEPHDYFRYTIHGLRYLLEKTGFSVEEHRAQGTGASLAFQSLNLAILHFGAETRIGSSMPARIFKLPIYLVVNIVAILAKTFLRNPRDVMNHLVVARKR